MSAFPLRIHDGVQIALMFLLFHFPSVCVCARASAALAGPAMATCAEKTQTLTESLTSNSRAAKAAAGR